MRPCEPLHAEPDMANCETCRRYYTDPRARAAMDGMATQRGACLFVDDSPLEHREVCCPRKWPHGCELYGTCYRDYPDNSENKPSCAQCVHWHARTDPTEPREPERLLFVDEHCPGDAVVLSAAIESLHRQYPGEYITNVRSAASDIWQQHPLVRDFAERLPHRVCPASYELIHASNQRAVHFMHAYCLMIENFLGRPVPLLTNRPHLYLSAEEKAWLPQVQELLGAPTPYVVVNAGRKDDYTAKWWGTANFQHVVDALRGRVLFVQIGELEHHHPPLRDALDLRGQTTARQLMRLVHHARAGVGPSTFLQHVCAALERPYVLLAGGREPATWQAYPRQIMFSTQGRLPCCAAGGCWRSQTTLLPGADAANTTTCERPMMSGADVVPQCLQMIHPDDVARAIVDVYELHA